MASLLVPGLLALFGAGVLVLGRESMMSPSEPQAELFARYQAILLQATTGRATPAALRELARELRRARPPMTAQADQLERMAAEIERSPTQGRPPIDVANGDRVEIPLPPGARSASTTIATPPVPVPANATAVHATVTNAAALEATLEGFVISPQGFQTIPHAQMRSVVVLPIGTRVVQRAPPPATPPPPPPPVPNPFGCTPTTSSFPDAAVARGQALLALPPSARTREAAFAMRTLAAQIAVCGSALGPWTVRDQWIASLNERAAQIEASLVR